MKKKDLIQWEAIDTEIKEDSKRKKIIKKILSFISKYSGWLEAITMLFLALKMKETSKYWMILLSIAIYMFYRTIKRFYKVWKGKQIIINEELNKRVIGQEGAQGAGKTSLMFYIASILKQPVFSSAPAKINGEFTYKLTDKMLNMDVKLPYKSLIILDEISLYFDNSYSKFQDSMKTEGLERQMQLIRHCYDGQMLTASVDMNRVAKRIEEKHGMFRRLLGQASYRSSFIIDPIINMISDIFRLDIKTGYRVWTYQTFENINHEGYIFDLSRQDKNTKNSHFANLQEIWAFNSNINFEYDDRYFKKLYLELPKAKLEKWEDLNFNLEQLKDTGFNDVVKFFEKKHKEEDNKVGDSNALGN